MRRQQRVCLKESWNSVAWALSVEQFDLDATTAKVERTKQKWNAKTWWTRKSVFFVARKTSIQTFGLKSYMRSKEEPNLNKLNFKFKLIFGETKNTNCATWVSHNNDWFGLVWPGLVWLDESRKEVPSLESSQTQKTKQTKKKVAINKVSKQRPMSKRRKGFRKKTH